MSLNDLLNLKFELCRRIWLFVLFRELFHSDSSIFMFTEPNYSDTAPKVVHC